MSEESYRTKQKRNRILIWFGIALSLVSVIAFVPNPLPKPDYVPTIVNGLVASMSILMAFALFQLAQTHANIQDRLARAKFHLRASIYLSVLFGIMLLGIMFGYRLVLVNELGYAFIVFMSMFLIMFGLIMDLPTESG